MDLGEIYVAAPPRLWYACLATVVLTDAVVIPLAWNNSAETPPGVVCPDSHLESSSF